VFCSRLAVALVLCRLTTATLFNGKGRILNSQDWCPQTDRENVCHRSLRPPLNRFVNLGNGDRLKMLEWKIWYCQKCKGWNTGLAVAYGSPDGTPRFQAEGTVMQKSPKFLNTQWCSKVSAVVFYSDIAVAFYQLFNRLISICVWYDELNWLLIICVCTVPVSHSDATLRIDVDEQYEAYNGRLIWNRMLPIKWYQCQWPWATLKVIFVVWNLSN